MVIFPKMVTPIIAFFMKNFKYSGVPISEKIAKIKYSVNPIKSENPPYLSFEDFPLKNGTLCFKLKIFKFPVIQPTYDLGFDIVKPPIMKPQKDLEISSPVTFPSNSKKLSHKLIQK